MTARDSPSVFLLSIYDEYTIAYKDRGYISQTRDIERMISRGNAMTAVIIVNGRVAGTWKRTLKKKTIEISLKPFRNLDDEELGGCGIRGDPVREIFWNPCSPRKRTIKQEIGSCILT